MLFPSNDVRKKDEIFDKYRTKTLPGLWRGGGSAPSNCSLILPVLEQLCCDSHSDLYCLTPCCVIFKTLILAGLGATQSEGLHQ